MAHQDQSRDDDGQVNALLTARSVANHRLTLRGGVGKIGSLADEDRVAVYDQSIGDIKYALWSQILAAVAASAGHTGTTGSVFFADSGGAGSDPTEDNDNFFWNDDDDYLALGHNAPTERLDIRGDITTDSLARIQRTGSNSTFHSLFVGPSGDTPDFAVWGDGRVAIGQSQATTNAQLRIKSTDATRAAALLVDQDDTGSVQGIFVDSEATTGDAVDIQGAMTTATLLDVQGDALTSGRLAYFRSGSTSPVTRDLFEILNSDPASDNATCLKIRTASDGRLLDCKHGLGADDTVFGVDPAGYILMTPDVTSDAAPDDNTTIKKLSIQRLGADPTNAAFIKFSNSPGTPTNDFYLVLEEEA